MKILVTGASGFVGKNLVENLKNIQNKKNFSCPNLVIDEIFEFDKNTEPSLLDKFCKEASFVFHFAGVNRPKNSKEFTEGNVGFSSVLISFLKKHKNRCPIVVASSVQATLLGRFKGSDYGKSKLEEEELFFKYGEESGADVLVYRFPNLFGKWCRPNYNSAVATFCHNKANDLPIFINDKNTELELLYIDDLVNEMLDALEGKGHCQDFEEEGIKAAFGDENKRKTAERRKFYAATPTYKKTLGEIAKLLDQFAKQPETLLMPELPPKSFEKKLYSTYLSYLPENKIAVPLRTNTDERGSFSEIMKTRNCGQFSINISKPGKTKGEHWHNTKWELFVVVSGRGIIEQRKIGSDKILRFEVSGEELKAVHILPGYTHNIINASKTENLITLMWANEPFDKDNPDTFREKVEADNGKQN